MTTDERCKSKKSRVAPGFFFSVYASLTSGSKASSGGVIAVGHSIALVDQLKGAKQRQAEQGPQRRRRQDPGAHADGQDQGRA